MPTRPKQIKQRKPLRKKRTAKKAAKRATRGKLNQKWTDEFSKLVACQKLAARGRIAQERANMIRDAIVIEMGLHTECRLKDGRTIRRIPQKRHLPPLPAKTIRWQQVKDVTDELVAE